MTPLRPFPVAAWVALSVCAALVAVPLPRAAGQSNQSNQTGQTGQTGQSRGWTWPLSPPRVVGPFATGPFPWSPGHRGLDLAAPPGTVVRAPAAGVVSFSGPVAGRPVLVIAHPAGGGRPALRSSFEPVRGELPVGSAVRLGEVIGRVGPGPVAGRDAADHCSLRGCLHWGVREGQTYVDPSLLVRPRPVVLLPLGYDASPSLARSCRTALVCI